LLAIALVIIAAARPQSGEAHEIVKGEGVDIALALDMSGSMSALDFEPDNRLEAAKGVIADFIAERKYDRVGLVVFAKEAFIHSPPTIDHRVLSFLLDEVELASDLRIQDGTAIGLGLAAAANMLRESDSKSRVIVLLTDGVNNSGAIDPLTAALAAKTLDIKVYTIGIGRPEGALVTPRSIGGNWLVLRQSAVDEETLREIAATTGGRYFRASDTQGLREIYDEINALEKTEVEVRQITRYRELSVWLLIPVALLLLVSLVAGSTYLRTVP
jgi:Ca-activated chloride channel family protein